MNLKVVIECLKGFAIGAVIGLLIMYFRKSDSFVSVFLCGFITMSIYIKNNFFIKN